MARRLRLDEAVDLFLDHIKVERGLARLTLDAYGRDLARSSRTSPSAAARTSMTSRPRTSPTS